MSVDFTAQAPDLLFLLGKMPPISLRTWAKQIRILEQMFTERKYTSTRIVLSGSDFVHLCSCADAAGELVNVYITEENKVGVKTLRRVKEESRKAKGSVTIILLCPSGLTPFAQKELSLTEDEPNCRMEVFRKAELAFNVTKHALVPSHVPLLNTEKKQLLLSLGSKATSLPKIKESDPVVKFLGLPIGTVVEIRRAFGGLETELYYRIVVA